MSANELSRRSFLQHTGLYGGGLVLAWHLPRPRAARAAAASQDPLSLTATEWKTLEAVTSRIIPTDEQPGAREAGCVNFIDKALANEDAAALLSYQVGLAGVEEAAKAAQGEGELGFAELDAGAQDALLRALQGGSAKGWPASAGDSAAFFEMVRQHTIVGFLADPSYGGNRDMAGWKVAGYPGPRHHRGGYSNEQVTGEASVTTAWGEEI